MVSPEPSFSGSGRLHGAGWKHPTNHCLLVHSLKTVSPRTMSCSQLRAGPWIGMVLGAEDPVGEMAWSCSCGVRMTEETNLVTGVMRKD